MASIRSLVGVLCAALVVTACGSPPAQAQSWQVIEQPGGYKVARVSMTGGATGIGLTCERKVPVIALSLARAPARNPALLSLSDGKATGKLAVVRNGATNVWAGAVRDVRVLDMLARAASVEVAVDGVRYGTVSLAGAADAMRGALVGCWAGTTVAADAPTSGAAAPPTKFGTAPMAVADTSSPETSQTSFPTRDPKTGKPRLPIRLGAYVAAGSSCARPGEGLIFVDSGNGAHFEFGAGPLSTILTIRTVKPGTYTTREELIIQDTGYGNYTYVVADPDHFSVTSKDGFMPGDKTTERYSYCSQPSLPIKERGFLAIEMRRLPVLPVIAGYYEIWASDATPRKPTCEEYCGYLLITERGIAQATRYAYAEPKGKIDRQAILSPSITQDAPLHYFVKGKADYPSFGFTMDGAGGFTIDPDGEGSTVHVRRIDPAKIPAAMMPSF